MQTSELVLAAATIAAASILASAVLAATQYMVPSLHSWRGLPALLIVTGGVVVVLRFVRRLR